MADDADRFVPVADGPCAGQRVAKLRSAAGNWWIHSCLSIPRRVGVGVGEYHRYRYDHETETYVYQGERQANG